jgi:hypothetical protein
MTPCPFNPGDAVMLHICIGCGARLFQPCVVIAVRHDGVVFDFDHGAPIRGRPLIARRRRNGQYQTDGGAILSHSTKEILADLSKGT